MKKNSRLYTFLSILILSFCISSCDGSGVDSSGEVTGMWEEITQNSDGFTPYALVEEDQVTFYLEGHYDGICLDIIKWKILETDGNSYLMKNETGAESTFEITRDGDQLFINDDLTYEESDLSEEEVKERYPLCDNLY